MGSKHIDIYQFIHHYRPCVPQWTTHHAPCTPQPPPRSQIEVKNLKYAPLGLTQINKLYVPKSPSVPVISWGSAQQQHHSGVKSVRHVPACTSTPRCRNSDRNAVTTPNQRRSKRGGDELMEERNLKPNFIVLNFFMYWWDCVAASSWSGSQWLYNKIKLQFLGYIWYRKR